MEILEQVHAREFLSPAAVRNIEDWLQKPKYAEYREELIELLTNGEWQLLEDAFFKVIEFGTAGRRGTTGLGSNRINRVTVGESAQALCEYVKQFDEGAPEKGIAIAYDTRLSSEELSKYVASVCAANGFKTYIFESYRSTPELSFAVRELGCAAGVVITASHNPPADNGFKGYWSDGAQIAPPHDKGVLDVATRVEEIHAIDFEQGVNEGRIILLGKEMDEKYVATIAAQAEGTDRDVRIVYSPLHGAGQRNTLLCLRAVGFADVRPVEEQMIPDGNFPTVENGKPNPEERAANARAVAKMLAEDADIAITNDPDADRFGIMVRQGDEVVYLSGNQAGALATEYILNKKQAKNTLTPQHYVIKTIVTTDLMEAIAKHYGVTCYGNLLVGFKYIGKLIREKEGTGEEFVFGLEESFGGLKGDYARDKDGATGSLPLAEYAAELKKEGKTLWDQLLELYRRYGLYYERMDKIVCPGASGFEEMQAMMQTIRTNPPHMLDGHTVTAVLDYQTLTRTNLADSSTSPIDCETANVVVLEFDNDSRRRITVRPSGTEPLIKLYVQWYDDASEDIAAQYVQLGEKLEGFAMKLEGLLKEPANA